MTRALVCSVVLLSLSSCSSSSSNGAGNAGGRGNVGGNGNSAGVGNPSGGSGNSVGGSGNAAAGTAGAGASTAGSAGTSSTGGSAGTGPVSSGASVTQWGGDIAHTAHYTQATLTKANMAKMAVDTFAMPVAPATESAAKFAGEIAAIPLYLAGATAGTGEYIVATTQNDVYAFNEATGALAWKHNIGAALGVGTSRCGTPTNHGIVSTPVIDAAGRVIYLSAGMPDHHEIHALNADTGMELSGGWPVNVSNMSAGTLKFADADDAQSQRSALALVGGIVYVAYGGYCGDQGAYHGWVVGVDSKDPTKTGAWATMDDKLAGIWAPGGMASDGNGVFAVTGNVKSGVTDHSKTDSEEIIRITGLGVASHATKDLFFPTEWMDPMNKSDQDFGSSSPAVVTVPNSTPSTIVVAPSKPGRVYFLDAANLGGSLGQFADLAVADTGTAQSVYTAPSAYQSASGVHVAITTGTGSQCPAPVGVNDSSVMSILLQPGATPDKAPTPKIVWCAKVGVDASTHRSPISTNSGADAIVWLMNGSKLNGFDGETGAVVFDGGTSTCAGVHTFTQVIAANGHIVTAGETGGQAHLCSWSVH